MKRFEDLSRCVEHFGGPDDGAFLPIGQNTRRPGGQYVPMNALVPLSLLYVITGMRFVPDEPTLIGDPQ